MIEKNKLHAVYLALGSNLGNRQENLHQALLNIQKRIGRLVAQSAFYVTSPVGFVSDKQFLNAACLVETSLHPLEILEVTQLIEKELGRKTKSENRSYADRMIDIDLLFFDDEIVAYPQLVLPHPHLHERAFVLYPLAEIAPLKVHPVLGKTMGELKDLLPYDSSIEPVTDAN